MLNKTNYLITIPGGLTLVYVLVLLAWLNRWSIWLLLAAFCVFVISLTMIFVLTYQMWTTIQDGHARMKPWQAIMYNFIPIWNFYWLFQCIWGFSKDANAYINRHAVQAKQLPEHVFFWYVALWFVSALPYIGLVTVPICIILVSSIVSTTLDLMHVIRLHNSYSRT